MSAPKTGRKHLAELEQQMLAGIPAVLDAPLKPYSDVPAQRGRGRAKLFSTICGECMSKGPISGVVFEFYSENAQVSADMLGAHYEAYHPRVASRRSDD